MKAPTKKQAHAKYIAGCEYFGIAPEYQYKELTAKQFVAEVNKLGTRARNDRIKEAANSVARNTRNVVQYVEQGIGEPLSHARDRAIALAKRTGRAIPFTITRK